MQWLEILLNNHRSFHSAYPIIPEFRVVNTKSRVINYRQEEKKILDRIIRKDVYDTRMRPKGVNSTSESVLEMFFGIGCCGVNSKVA